MTSIEKYQHKIEQLKKIDDTAKQSVKKAVDSLNGEHNRRGGADNE